MGGATVDVPGAADMAGGGNVVDFDRLKAAAHELQFTLAAPPLAGGADLTGYRYVVHPDAPF